MEKSLNARSSLLRSAYLTAALSISNYVDVLLILIFAHEPQVNAL